MGYTQTHKTMTETQTLYAPISGAIEAQKTGTASNFKLTKTPQEINEHKKIIERIQKDHVSQNFGIDLGEKKSTDYRNHFNDDEKMKSIREQKDKQYHQTKNELNWYVEEYIKTKESLRK